MMYSTERRPSPTPNQPVNIFNGGGWDDDCEDNDEDDYVDMAPVKPSPSRLSSNSKPTCPNYPAGRREQSGNRLTVLKQTAPEVVVCPASPHGSIGSVRTASMSELPSSSDSSSGSDSESDYCDSLTKNILTKLDTGGLKHRSNSRTSIPSPETVVRSPPPLPQRKSTNAGQAARMYLQQTAKIADSAKSSSGLQRSSSRVGTRGVQSRVMRSRAHVSMRSHSTDELDSGAGEGVDDESKISRARLKSRTLDRSLSGLKPPSSEGIPKETEGDDKQPTDKDKRKSRDGSAVIGLISDRRRKSQSLDAKYLQYLDGISKHASAPNSPKTSWTKKDKKKDSKSKKKKKITSEPSNEVDDEEEYRRYTQAMASRTNRSAHSTSSPDLSLQCDDNIGQNLADFVKERTKFQKSKKSPGLVGRFSIRKSKTSGKLDSDSPLSQQEMNKENNDVVSEKSNSLKKEKRKSWRKKHGFSIKTRSKERTYSDPPSPPTSPPLDDSTLLEEKDNKETAKGPPQIKQTLGINGSYSPNLKVRSVIVEENRSQRVNSLDPNDPELTHSPKIMSLSSGRSVTLDNRRSSKEAYQSNGTLTHAKLHQVSSWNSEYSTSNTDLNLLEDEYPQSGSRSGTLTRLLGRKPKSSRIDGSEYDESELGYGSLGRKRAKKGKYATLGSPMMARRGKEIGREAFQEFLKPPDPITQFILSKNFVRGFRVTLEDDESDEFEDSDLNEIGLTFESAGVNKYATITGAKSAGYWNYDTKRLKKQNSDNSAEASRIGLTESPAMHRRNKSLPLVDVPVKSKSSKGKGGSAHRNVQRSVSSSPANHLSFGDVLTENDAMYAGSDRFAPSPLRSRKLNVIEPLLEEPSAKIFAAAKTLYRCLIGTSTNLLRTHHIDDEKDSYFETTLPEEDVIPSYESSILGCELVAWLVDQMPIGNQESAEASAEKRRVACGMLQALLEEGALSHVRREHNFQDSCLLYQFHESVQKLDQSCLQNGRPMSGESSMSSTYNSDGRSLTSVDTNEMDEPSMRSSRASSIQSRQVDISDNMVPSIVDEQELKEVLSVLQNVAPDAMFRMVLRKLPDERTPEELMMIYEEILHIKALSHLSDSVKRELAGVLKFEFHRKSRKTLFSQGDEGRSWYIIIKGSVDVDIQGQGVVCTLHEGDDFGNLAIINDAPRAATIVLAEDNCQLLRVDKHDFVRILKDVEANTVRLKEHEKDVLVLQKIHARSSSTGRQEKYLNNNTKPDHRIAVAATPTRSHHRYAISAGTPTKIVEHIVKSLKPWSTAKQCDEAMEDLILMYQVFMSTQDICKCLMNLYHSEKAEQIDATKSIKRKVVYFVVRWSHIATHIFYDQPAIGPFLKELKQAVQDDEKVYPTLREDLARIFVSETSSDAATNRGWITVDSTTINRFPSSDIPRAPHQAIKATDDVMLKVYNVNSTYTTVKLPILSTVSEIISAVAEKQGRDSEELQLIQVQSDGDMYGLPKTMTSAATSLGVNSKLFACTTEEKDSISPLEEQRIVPTNNVTVLELVGSQEIAEHITQFDWELVNSIHVMEFVHKVFGSHKFHSVTSNIDVFAKRFNQLAYWAPTEICACNNINKRVHLLRKFIKIAQHLKELQNMNAFMAVMIGLGNQSISRLHATWDKLPTKYKKLMSEFEAVLDPSRNHRAYRHHVATLRPPMIPYLPLLMKDMTFQHEGNDSKRNGLINFEKMHMMSNTIRGVVQACCKPYELTNAVISSKSFDETRQYTRSFEVVTDQKLLNSLSGKIEAKR